jgi:hypothetical protein
MFFRQTGPKLERRSNEQLGPSPRKSTHSDEISGSIHTIGFTNPLLVEDGNFIADHAADVVVSCDR